MFNRNEQLAIRDAVEAIGLLKVEVEKMRAEIEVLRERVERPILTTKKDKKT